MVAKTPEQAATAAKESRNVDQIDCPPDGGDADQLSVTGCASRQSVGLEHCAIAKPIYVAIEDDFMDTAARQIFRIISADARFVNGELNERLNVEATQLKLKVR